MIIDNSEGQVVAFWLRPLVFLEHGQCCWILKFIKRNRESVYLSNGKVLNFRCWQLSKKIICTRPSRSTDHQLTSSSLDPQPQVFPTERSPLSPDLPEAFIVYTSCPSIPVVELLFQFPVFSKINIINLFIYWPHWVLVVACKIFIVSFKIFHCGIPTL